MKRSITINKSDVLILKANCLVSREDAEIIREEIKHQIEEGVVFLPLTYDFAILQRDHIPKEGEE